MSIGVSYLQWPNNYRKRVTSQFGLVSLKKAIKRDFNVILITSVALYSHKQFFFRPLTNTECTMGLYKWSPQDRRFPFCVNLVSLASQSSPNDPPQSGKATLSFPTSQRPAKGHRLGHGGGRVWSKKFTLFQVRCSFYNWLVRQWLYNSVMNIASIWMTLNYILISVMIMLLSCQIVSREFPVSRTCTL